MIEKISDKKVVSFTIFADLTPLMSSSSFPRKVSGYHAHECVRFNTIKHITTGKKLNSELCFYTLHDLVPERSMENLAFVQTLEL